jgi:ribosome-binding protein aMBF1 (putative translation factor)
MPRPDGRKARKRTRDNEDAFQRLLESIRPELALRREMLEARLRAGLTQQQLAQRMNTTQSAIARWESGDSLPGFKTLMKLASVTGFRLIVRFEENTE